MTFRLAVSLCALLSLSVGCTLGDPNVQLTVTDPTETAIDAVALRLTTDRGDPTIASMEGRGFPLSVVLVTDRESGKRVTVTAIDENDERLAEGELSVDFKRGSSATAFIELKRVPCLVDTDCPRLGDWVCSQSLCRRAGCGDGLVSVSENELCDDGNAFFGDGCSTTCQLETGWACNGEPSVCGPICGDGVMVGDEQCDDGNTNGGDGCRQCRLVPTSCGDGFVNDGIESCDDGPNNSDQTPDACRLDCERARCGDGVIDTGEQCDDGNGEPCDGCRACRIVNPSGCCESDATCGAYLCRTEIFSCFEACEGEDSARCSGGFHCDDSDCLLDLARGETCDEPDDCISDNCGNSVCCDGGRQCCTQAVDCESTGYACDPVASACHKVCETSAECQSTHYCDAGVCVLDLAPGAACTGNDQCNTDYCEDFCCLSGEECCAENIDCSQAGDICADGFCQPPRENARSCVNDSQCASGNCGEVVELCCDAGKTCCATDQDCPGNHVCNVSAALCVDLDVISTVHLGLGDGGIARIICEATGDSLVDSCSGACPASSFTCPTGSDIDICCQAGRNDSCGIGITINDNRIVEEVVIDGVRVDCRHPGCTVQVVRDPFTVRCDTDNP